ncbi:hypothetical protein AHiyo6_01080 [Arthrobacter sp. Hiyo6]|nr:hypothetical protein AHiyo6_01080 [Arthrobacter sp. Hiyo6]
MINRTTQTVQTELARRLPATERAIRDIKNKQLIGADSLPVIVSNQGNYTSVYAAGSVGGIVLNVFAAQKKLYLSEVKMSFYINNDLNPAYAWPWGASINPNQLDITHFLDLAYSDELGTGNKTYSFRIANTSASSFTLYMHFAVIYSSQPLTI